jgi:RNA polymerase sigma-70 factor (ECF subfamily)
MPNSTLNPTSLSLLERLHEPTDQEAWRHFVHLYTPLLYTWARRQGFSEHDAADAVQELFTRLLEGIKLFDPDRGQFRGWLFKVFLHLCREIARKRRGVLPLARLVELDRLADSDSGAGWVEEEYRRQLVHQAREIMAAEFSDTTCRACWEYVARGRPAAEVADELGVTPDAVYQAKYRVLPRLRQELEGLLD